MLEKSKQHPADHNSIFALSYHNEELLRSIGRSHLMGTYYLSRHSYSEHDIAKPHRLFYLTIRHFTKMHRNAFNRELPLSAFENLKD